VVWTSKVLLGQDHVSPDLVDPLLAGLERIGIEVLQDSNQVVTMGDSKVGQGTSSDAWPHYVELSNSEKVANLLKKQLVNDAQLDREVERELLS